MNWGWLTVQRFGLILSAWWKTGRLVLFITFQTQQNFSETMKVVVVTLETIVGKKNPIK